MEVTERIAQLLDEKYATDEVFADCFTVEIDLKPGHKLFVFADSDSGMTFEKCQKLSRYLEAQLDTNGWLGDSYMLEVSSPGVLRPLQFARQYPRNIGRTLDVTLKDATKQSGIMTAADDTQIVLRQEVIEMDGKKKKKVQVETPILLENIEKALVKLAF